MAAGTRSSRCSLWGQPQHSNLLAWATLDYIGQIPLLPYLLLCLPSSSVAWSAYPARSSARPEEFDLVYPLSCARALVDQLVHPLARRFPRRWKNLVVQKNLLFLAGLLPHPP